jgi:hypothetical protein
MYIPPATATIRVQGDGSREGSDLDLPPPVKE